MDLVGEWAAIRRPELIERYKRIRQERWKLFEEGARNIKCTRRSGEIRLQCTMDGLTALREMISRPAPVGSIWIEAVRKATPAEMKNAPRSGNSGGANNNKTQC